MAIYCRISRDRTGAGLGVDRQERECREWAERHGWTVVKIYTDNDLSAYSGRRRPGYAALLADVEAGRVDGVLVWHTDRLHRSPVELEQYIATCETRGVPTFTVTSGPLDLSTPTGRLQARVVGGVARYESEHRAERVSASRRDRALNGAEGGGGVRPYGFGDPEGERYHRTRPIVESEAAVIRQCAESVLAGVPLRAIVRDLNARGIPTVSGKPWRNSPQVRDMLLRPRNAGIAVHNGQQVGRLPGEPVLAEDTWRALVEKLTDPGRQPARRGPANRWLLSGIAQCACGQPVAVNQGKRAAAYVCKTRAGVGPHIRRNVAHVDEYVTEHVLSFLARKDMRDLITESSDVDTARLRAERDTLRQRLDALAIECAEGEISARQLAIASTRLNEKLDDIESRLRQSVQTSAVSASGVLDGPPADLQERWRGLPLGTQRAVIKELMGIQLVPGRHGAGFDSSAVKITPAS